MAFDWNSFTTNFLNTISTGINQRVQAAADEKKLLDKEYEDSRTVFKNRKKTKYKIKFELLLLWNSYKS